MARYVELRRHTDNDGDALSEEGVRAALEIGRGLAGSYALLVSTGAQRATQTLACFACMLREPVPGGAVVEAGLRSQVEDRWRDAYKRAGSSDLEALRKADPELVDEDSAVVGAALGRVIERLPEGGRALAVGHSPTNEAAVLGLTGSIVEPMAKGAGVLVVADGDHAHAEPLPPAQRSQVPLSSAVARTVAVERAVDLVAPRARFNVAHEGASEVRCETIARQLFRDAD